MEVTDHKYNLSPRKQFCGAKLGTDYSSMRTSYDEIYMQDYEKDFIKTSDGLITLPSRDSIYSSLKKQKYPYLTCVMLMDTDRERNIKLGMKYKFPAMTEG